MTNPEAADAAPLALAHDYLLVMRGAERTFAELGRCWPGAPVYTLLYDEGATGGQFADRPVITSALQRLGIRQDGFRWLAPLFPVAARRLPTDRHRVLVSSSSAFAHGFPIGPDSVHVCYCHTPFRYAWFEQERALSETPAALRPLVKSYLSAMRRSDLEFAARVTRYVANSHYTRARINAVWNRDAEVVYPPVSIDRFEIGEPEDRVLVVCELVRHKRVDVALEAARRAGVPMTVVGEGPERKRLQARYGDRARFMGRIDDQELARVYQRALALVVPNVEEFGIAAVEAQAAGRPVVAVDEGGAKETIIPGETGVLSPPDADSLAEVLSETDFTQFRAERIRENAARFAPARFREKMTAQVQAVTA